MKFHWMKIISLAAIAMVRGQNNEISFFGRERERGEGAGGTVPRSSKTSVVSNKSMVYLVSL